MKFVEKTHSSIKYWIIDSWEEVGFVHGFVGADLDLRISKDQAEKFLASLVNKETAELFLLKQIHSDQIIAATENDIKKIKTEILEGDGWTLNTKDFKDRNLFFGIKTADCYPVIIYCPVTKLAANLHCGWRGTLSGLLIKAINELEKNGAKRENLEVAIGPGAGVCCYEVGEDFISIVKNLKYLDSKNIAEVLLQKESKICCDIEKLLLIQLGSLGITKVKAISLCTICNKNFFSFRRQKEAAGRQLSFII